MERKADTGNAQIRKGSPKRTAPDANADEAQRLLEDPAFNRGFDAVHEGIVNTIANIQHDGQPATDAHERELCRTLRTLHSVKKVLSRAVQGQQLRLHDFKPRVIEPDEQD